MLESGQSRDTIGHDTETAQSSIRSTTSGMDTWSNMSQRDREATKARVAVLERMGYSVYVIAERVDLPVYRVKWIAKQTRSRAAQEAIDDMKVVVLRKLKILEDVRMEAYEALQESKKAAETHTYESGEAAHGGFSKSKKETKGRLAGSEYMKIILDTVKQERELLGLDAAIKIDVTSGGVPFPWRNLIGRPEVTTGDEIEAELARALPPMSETPPAPIKDLPDPELLLNDELLND